MARFEFRLPDIGEGIHEGEVVGWHVRPGDLVHEHDPMVDVMTDKTTVTIGAPRDGRIAELRAEIGTTAHVGEVLVVIDTNGATIDTPLGLAMPEGGMPGALPEARANTGLGTAQPARIEPARGPAPASVPPPIPSSSLARASEATPSVPAPRGETVASAVGDIRESLPGSRYFSRSLPPPPDYFCEKPLATPATRKLARELEVDLRRVRPTGPGRRVTSDDVRAHHEHHGHPLPPAAGRPEDRRVPFVGLRRKIAQRMQHAVTTAAHFTFVEECDVGRLLALREGLRPHARERGVDLHLLPFVVKAVCDALRAHPALNCALDEEANEIVYRSEVHVGIATSTNDGLVVPVVRNADQRSILGLAREIDRVSRAAREGRIKPSELSGSTFTVTSLGKMGGLFATPVLNMPEVGILGVHQIKKKPVVRGDRIEIGDVMLLSLTCDHRLVDGHVGAAFAYAVIDALEHPERMLAEALDR